MVVTDHHAESDGYLDDRRLNAWLLLESPRPTVAFISASRPSVLQLLWPEWANPAATFRILVTIAAEEGPAPVLVRGDRQ